MLIPVTAGPAIGASGGGGGGSVAYAAEVLADSPAGYWPLDEGSGTTATDASGNGNDGTYGGSPSLASRTLNATLGDVSDFDGTDDTITAPASASLGGGAATVSVEAWVIFDSVSGSRILFTDDNTGGDSPLFYFWYKGSTTQLVCGWRTSSTYRDHLVTWTPSTATLYHLAATVDGTTVRFYVDGVQIGTAAQVSAPVPSSSGTWTIGTDFGGTSPTDGAIGHVAFYHTALSAARVAAHYVAGQGYYYDTYLAAEPDVVAYWPLDEAAEPYLDRVASYDLSDGAGTPVPSSVATPVGTNSIDFTNANVTVTNNLGLTAYPFTFEAWVRQDAAGDGAAIHLGADGGTNGVSWGHGNTTLDGASNNNIIALIDAVAWKSLSPTFLVTDEWVHVCVVFGVSNVYVYKNGVLGTSVATSAMVTPSAEFYIGGYSTSSRYFNGKIGQVSVYDTEFTAAQAMLHYGAGSLGMAP